jgi:hypothetical protein
MNPDRPPALKVVSLARILAVRLYQYAHEDVADGRVYAKSIARLFKVNVSKNMLVAAADILRSDGYVSRHTDNHGDQYYKMKTEGILFVEENLEKPTDMAAYYHRGEESLYDLAAVAVPYNASIPASDRVVTIGHNQPTYVEATAALDKVIEEFANDHRLDNELGREKGALQKVLEAGRDLLRDTVINVKVGTMMLIEPLRRIAEKYDAAIVGALAKEAIEKILALFV